MLPQAVIEERLRGKLPRHLRALEISHLLQISRSSCKITEFPDTCTAPKVLALRVSTAHLLSHRKPYAEGKAGPRSLNWILSKLGSRSRVILHGPYMMKMSLYLGLAPSYPHLQARSTVEDVENPIFRSAWLIQWRCSRRFTLSPPFSSSTTLLTKETCNTNITRENT